MIKWNKNIIEAIEREAENAYPFECCGFLLGHADGDEASVQEILPVTNNHSGEKRRRFYIDPVDYMRAERVATSKGYTLIGVYHSHPDHPAIPSPEDEKYAVEGFHYPIVSVKDGEAVDCKSWLPDGNGSFEEETIINQIQQTN